MEAIAWVTDANIPTRLGICKRRVTLKLELGVRFVMELISILNFRFYIELLREILFSQKTALQLVANHLYSVVAGLLILKICLLTLY